MHLASIKIWLPGDSKPAESLFVLLFFWIKSRYKNKCGGDLSNTIYKLIWDLSPNMLHNIDGLSHWRIGQMGSREGWPNLWFNQTNSNFPQSPLLPLETMVCANILLLLPKSLSLMLITKKLNSIILANLMHSMHFMINLHTLYSLTFTLFLWTKTW